MLLEDWQASWNAEAMAVIEFFSPDREMLTNRISQLTAEWSGTKPQDRDDILKLFLGKSTMYFRSERYISMYLLAFPNDRAFANKLSEIKFVNPIISHIFQYYTRASPILPDWHDIVKEHKVPAVFRLIVELKMNNIIQYYMSYANTDEIGLIVESCVNEVKETGHYNMLYQLISFPINFRYHAYHADIFFSPFILMLLRELGVSANRKRVIFKNGWQIEKLNSAIGRYV